MTQLPSPKISVIIPVKNASKTIVSCLDSVYLNNYDDFDVVVVDDGCEDNTIDIVSKYNCVILKNDIHHGVSGARNIGAFSSKGDVLVFIDSDIVIPKDALLNISLKMQHYNIDAVVGILGEKIRFNNFSSQYKNLWMYYTFNNLPNNISLIFTSIAGIKRNVFLKYGGFDINYKTPNVEDNEFGIRLSEARHNIVLDKTLQVEHLKYYNIYSLLRTHYFRAKGLIKLYNRKKLIRLSRNNPSSVPTLFIFNIPLSVILISLLLSLPFKNQYFLKTVIASFLLLLFICINYSWFYFLNKKRGVLFTIKSIVYLTIESIVIIFGLMIGQIEFFIGRRY